MCSWALQGHLEPWDLATPVFQAHPDPTQGREGMCRLRPWEARSSARAGFLFRRCRLSLPWPPPHGKETRMPFPDTLPFRRALVVSSCVIIWPRSPSVTGWRLLFGGVRSWRGREALSGSKALCHLHTAGT